MAQPFEILASPYTLYLAPVGTPFPTVDDPEPFADIPAWIKVGTAGANNYTDVGVTVTHNQTIAEFTPAGTTAPVKAWRTDEKLDIAVVLADISPAQYALILNNLTVTTVAATTGVAGQKYFSLQRGIQVATFAMVCRGLSPAGDAFNAQYQIPQVISSGNPAPVYKKGVPAELAITFSTLLPFGGGGFGEFHVQTAAHL